MTTLKFDANATSTTHSYEDWRKLYVFDAEETLGIHPDDLPDIFSEAAAYESGSTVGEAVRELIEAQLEEMGLDPDDDDSLAFIGL